MNESSSLVYVENTPFVLRVTGVQEKQAKPLSEVSEAIRKQLFSKQIKEAIEKAGKDILSASDIVYTEKNENRRGDLLVRFFLFTRQFYFVVIPDNSPNFNLFL